ncbi:MAG: hypothetical protein ABGX16_12245 [Pirellulales bacterium]
MSAKRFNGIQKLESRDLMAADLGVDVVVLSEPSICVLEETYVVAPMVPMQDAAGDFLPRRLIQWKCFPVIR